MPTLLFLNLLLGGAAIALAVILLSRIKHAQQAQEALLQSLLSESSSAMTRLSWFRINFVRPAHYAKRFKWQAFEAKGLLINEVEHIRILAQLTDGEKLDLRYPKANLHLQWVGNPRLGDGHMNWVEIGNGSDTPVMFCADTGYNTMQIRLATADIFRNIAPHLPLPHLALKEYALEKNKASLATMLLTLALFLYAFIDGILLNKSEVLELGFPSGLVGLSAFLALPLYFMMQRHKVPGKEAGLLAFFAALGLVCACVPTLQRVDQLLSKDGSKAVAYRLKLPATLVPVDAGPPEIDYSSRTSYWAQFKQGSIHEVNLIHGPLGLWQLDHTKTAALFTRFYENERRKKQEEKEALKLQKIVN